MKSNFIGDIMTRNVVEAEEFSAFLGLVDYSGAIHAIFVKECSSVMEVDGKQIFVIEDVKAIDIC